MALDQETRKQLVGLTPVSSETAEILNKNPNLAISASTGEIVDVGEIRDESIERQVGSQENEAVAVETVPEEDEPEPEPDQPDPVVPTVITSETVDRLDEVHHTVDQPTEEDYAKDPNYTRLDNLPSKFIFYPYSQIFARSLTVTDWVVLTQAVNHQNITEFLDLFDTTLSVPIRDLAFNDFIWFMYWQRMRSFPRQPLQITWVSRYGNQNQTQVTSTEQVVDTIKIDREEYDKLQKNGYRVPTARDYEILMSGYLTPEQMDTYRIAQYLEVDLDYPDEKTRIENQVKDSIERVGTLPLDQIAELDEVKEKLQFGVKNSIELVDEHFNIEDWKVQLAKGVKIIRNNPDAEQSMADFLDNQLSRIKLDEEAGEDVGGASPEMISLGFSPWGFFPNVSE